MVVACISGHSSFQQHLLLVGAAFPGAAPKCFCWSLSGVLPLRTISGNSNYLHRKFPLAPSALSKCALHRSVFRRAGCHIPGSHSWSCSLWYAVCDLSAFFLLKASWESIDRQAGSILNEVRAQNLLSGRPVIQSRLCLFLIA